MSGVQEILVLAVIVLAVLFIPRMRAGQRVEPENRPSLSQRLPGKMRLAIAASFVYPVLVAAFLQPWAGDPIQFVYIGCGPVVLLWLFYWIFVGFRKNDH